MWIWDGGEPPLEFVRQMYAQGRVSASELARCETLTAKEQSGPEPWHRRVVRHLFR